jgi:hypothetical protein
LDQNVSSSEVNVKRDTELVSKWQSRTGDEQNDRSSFHSLKLCSTHLSGTQVCSDSESSKECGKLHTDEVNLKSIGKSQNAPDPHNRSDEINLGKSGCRKVSLVGKTNASSKTVCSSMEESAESSVLKSVKKGTSSGSETAITGHGVLGSVEEKVAVDIKPSAAVSRTKIVLMQSDDDDDEDFINIKADAEAGKLCTQCILIGNCSVLLLAVHICMGFTP